MEKIIYAVLAVSEDKQAAASCLINGIKGFFGASLYPVFYNDLAAAVSEMVVPGDCIRKEMALAYASVISELNRTATLLPMRFGSVVESDEEISRLLANHYNAFANNLNEVNGKVEFGLKLLWDYEKGCDRIRANLNYCESDAGCYFSKATASTVYLLEKIKQHRLEDALLKHVESLVDEISLHLALVAPTCKFKKLVTNNIILDAAFLVDESKSKIFIEAIEMLTERHNDLHFLLTGPWPPYSFTEITVA